MKEGVTRDKIKSFMAKEKWFSGAELAEYFDVLIDEKAAVAACASDYFEKYNHVPESIKGTATKDIVDAVLAELENRNNAAAEAEKQRIESAKEELKELQEKFDLLFDLDEEKHEEIEDKVATGTAKTIGAKADKKNLVKAFVNIVKCGFLKREPDEGDVKVYKDALSTDTTKGDDDEMGIGVTVPEDIRTDIIELRRSEDNLEQYVNVEGVTTKSGSRNIEVDADSTPFDNVDEEADFPDMDEPKFKKIVYAIKKKGGILKITAELFEDTAANVMAYINKWIAKKTKATRNAMILKVADEMTKGKEVVISTIDSLKDVFNVGLDPAITTGAMVIANQNGYNHLDKLKDKDGKYILQPNPTQPTQMMLFGKYPIVKVSNRIVKSEPVY